ncbi:spore cortex-lytic enzyme [Salirhabdus salicampi]|uniref:spore cortex-lytic enzyme n=1 Tax=Salirhabdus salicampi TaxID=476102 RepID=UPI0020C337B2|nr:spore cortex-lytic enzyme [Salirhabdus salicampi]MCP8616720.1 spore cortex-lytic enzyme [Salirhabdus salicampi]
MKMKMFICFLLTLLFLSIIPLSHFDKNNTSEAFSPRILQRGSSGDDVIELQARLQYIGFYHGDIDGVFQWGTYWAVRNFQKEFGLRKVDGLVGEKTKEMLERATEYHKDWVFKQLREGNEFTHYGGMALEKQTKRKIDLKKNVPLKQNETTPQQNDQGIQKKNNQGSDQPNNQGAEQQPNNQGTEQPNNEGQELQQQPNQGTEQPGDAGEPNVQQQQNNGGADDQTPPQNEEQGNEESPEPASQNIPNGYSQNDIRLMANAVHGEARGEPYVGKVAVAAVILNRVESATFPNTVSGVIFEPRAFTAVSDGQIWLTPDDTARQAVIDAINGWDPSGDALYYYNPRTATSSWIFSRPQIKRIGQHIFCK